MNKNSCLFLFSLLLSTVSMVGQEEPTVKSVQDYTPSVLLNKGQSEFKLFNNLYTQKTVFDSEGNYQDADERSSFFTSISEYNYGLSPTVSLGGEMWFRSVYSGSPSSSATNVLTFSNSSNSRSGISLAGLKVKFSPIKKWRQFSVQSSLLFSVLSDPQSKNLDRPFLDNNRHVWATKFLLDKKISNKFQLFGQFTTWVNIDKDLSDENTSVATPLDLFISYFPNKKFTIYLQNQFWPSFGNDGLSSYFVQEGLGLKYLAFKGVEFETSYTGFVLGENSGAGQTVNLGIRILH